MGRGNRNLVKRFLRRHSQIIALACSVVAVPLAMQFLRPGPPPELDWRKVTIEGIHRGMTVTEMEARLGPAEHDNKDSYCWPRLGLSLFRDNKRWTLSGYRIECEGRVIRISHNWEIDPHPEDPESARIVLKERDIERLFGPAEDAERHNGDHDLSYKDGEEPGLYFYCRDQGMLFGSRVWSPADNVYLEWAEGEPPTNGPTARQL